MMRRDLKTYVWDGLAFRLSPCVVEFLHLSLLDFLCLGCGLCSFIGVSLDWVGTCAMVVGCSVVIFGWPGCGWVTTRLLMGSLSSIFTVGCHFQY